MFATKTKQADMPGKKDKAKSSTIQKKDKPMQLQALAYTHGADIYVAPHQEHHVPHEAWHVVQQMQNCPVQLKIDHLFNDIPDVIKEEGGRHESSSQKSTELRIIRDKESNKVADVHAEDALDPNHKVYTKHLGKFRDELKKFRLILLETDPKYKYSNEPLIRQNIYKAANAMWKNSIDNDVLAEIKSRGLNENVDADISNWNEQCYDCVNAVLEDNRQYVNNENSAKFNNSPLS